MSEASGPLHAALATNAAHVSALDAVERAFTAETALCLLRLSIHSSNDQIISRESALLRLRRGSV